MSVTVVATIFPKPEFHDEVIAAFESVIPAVHAQDEGCELYALHTGEDRLVMVEKWTSAEHLKAHGSSPALAALHPQLKGKLAQPTDVQVVQPRPVGTPEQGTL
jgi:quinol monooxygenase YgiN